MITDVLTWFAEATIAQRLAAVTGLFAIAIILKAVLSRQRIAPLPAQTNALQARLDLTTQRAEAAERDLRQLGTMLNALPGPVWRLDVAGELAWANSAYHALDAAALAVLDAASAGDIATLPGPEGRVLEIGTVHELGEGDVHYSLPADRLVETQASLRRFVDTLTQTFAHLPIGLAIFDRDRRLGLFNPALSDLLGLDPGWLAARPQFRAVMERLRDAGHMPDRADFQNWLRHVQEMEDSAANDSFDENWLLAGGQVMRVSGRPHPDGALAFVFEDISRISHVESRHRTDVALNQAILDRMTEAVAVFDTSGALLFANQAFDQLWDLDTAHSPLAPDICTLIARWSAQGGAAEDWDKLRAHVTGTGDRKSGQTLINPPRHGAMLCIWATLPDGSALVYFKPSPNLRQKHLQIAKTGKIRS